MLEDCLKFMPLTVVLGQAVAKGEVGGRSAAWKPRSLLPDHPAACPPMVLACPILPPCSARTPCHLSDSYRVLAFCHTLLLTTCTNYLLQLPASGAGSTCYLWPQLSHAATVAAAAAPARAPAMIPAQRTGPGPGPELLLPLHAQQQGSSQSQSSY